MPNSAVTITPGAGASIAVNLVGGLAYQAVKLDLGGDGVSVPAPGDGANGLDVDVTRVSGNVTVVQGTATNLKVDASGVPVPVTDNGSSISVDDNGGTLSIDDGGGSVTVDGSVAATCTQGSAAALTGAWPVKVSDGTDYVGISTVGGAKALKVDIVQAVSPASLVDKTAFTEGTSQVNAIGGEFNDSPSNPSSGQAAAARITQLRAVHVNLRKNDGTELGTSTAPIRTDPTGSTTQPVSGTVTANQGATAWVNNLTQINAHTVIEAANGIQKVGISDATGAAFSNASPLPVVSTPNPGTSWKSHLAFTASQTGIALRTPTGSKVTYVQTLTLTVTGTGAVTVFDNSDGATARLYSGTPPVGGIVHLHFNPPIALAAGGNVLKYTTGSGATGDVVANGYEL